MHEGYHGHEYSTENQQAAIDFSRPLQQYSARSQFFPSAGIRTEGSAVHALRASCPRLRECKTWNGSDPRFLSGAKNEPAIDLRQLYHSQPYPRINSWSVSQYEGSASTPGAILWQAMGTSKFQDTVIDRYLLRHSQYLAMPLVYIHKPAANRRILLWLGENGKLTAQDWPAVSKYLDAGYDIISAGPPRSGRNADAIHSSIS